MIQVVTPNYKNLDFTKYITRLVAQFCIDETAYFRSHDANISNEKNWVFSKDDDDLISNNVSVIYGDNAENNVIFLGRRLRGKISIFVNGSHSLIYIGNYCNLRGVEIHSCQDYDKVIIGSGVTTTNTTKLISGSNSGLATPSLIIGDDCMFSYNISVQNADEQPIFSLHDKSQLNSPTANVIIEPHVWIGQGSSILKDVTVGACSIVALGSVVTNSVPRFTVASGVPAITRPCKHRLWSRGYRRNHCEKAQIYYKKFVDQQKVILQPKELATKTQNDALTLFVAQLTTKMKAKINKKFRRVLKQALFIQESGFFDHRYYAKQEPTAASHSGGAIMHYVEIGAHKKLKPNVRFNTAMYLRYNADVVATGINPFYHYLKYGKVEGRTLR